MVGNDTEFYNSKIRNNEEFQASVNRMLSAFVDESGNAYSIDLSNYDNLNAMKQDLIEYIAAANIYEPGGENQLIGFRQSMFFKIGNEVTESSVINISAPISKTKIAKVLAIKDKKLVEITPTEFSNIIKEIEQVK